MIKKPLIIYSILFILCACNQTVDPHLAFKQGDYENAFAIWKIRATENDLEAQNALGTHYLLGLGVKKDLNLAKQWYQKAAELGYPDAQRNLGSMYESGYVNNSRDFEKAFIWFYAAHRQGHVHAGDSLKILAATTKLSPNNQMVLREEAQKYIINEILSVSDNDY
ncbi:hypothetical protein SPBRAN_1170 [uncultured Candidatus Thioglobus sp.]|nr:hypothetical protein SPBRAN_1170 [uncultured Candidatus Thioglobus sp.]